MENIAILVFIVLLLYLDVMAIYYAHKSDMFEMSQLIMQAVIVIVFPFIGGIFVLMFALSQINKQPSTLKPQEKTKARILHYLFLSFILVNDSTAQEHAAPGAGGDFTAGGDGGSGE